MITYNITKIALVFIRGSGMPFLLFVDRLVCYLTKHFHVINVLCRIFQEFFYKIFKVELNT